MKFQALNYEVPDELTQYDRKSKCILNVIYIDQSNVIVFIRAFDLVITILTV